MPLWFGTRRSEQEFRQLVSEGKHYLEIGELETARTCFEGAVTLGRKLWRDVPASLAEPLSGLATVTYLLGDKTRSLELAIETLHLAERAFGDGHPQTAIARDNAITCLEDLGRHREVVPLLEREVGRLGNQQRFETLLRMTHAHLAYGAFHLAKQVAERALAICDADSELAKVRDAALNQIGIAALWGGAPGSALDAFLEAYRFSAKDAGSSGREMSPPGDTASAALAGDPIYALNVGTALHALQRYDEAAEWTHRAFALRRTETEDVIEAIFANARAELEEAQGDLEGAEASYRWSLETFEKHLPPFHPRVVRTGVGLARTLRARGLHEESRLLARRVIDASAGYFLASHQWILEAAALARDE